MLIRNYFVVCLLHVVKFIQFWCCGEIIDVSEESEYDLFTERFGLGSRSSKSKSPDPFRLFKYSPDRKSSSGYFNVFKSVVLFFRTHLHVKIPHRSQSIIFFAQNYLHNPHKSNSKGGVSSTSPDFFEATGRRSSSGKYFTNTYDFLLISILWKKENYLILYRLNL